MLFYQDPRLLKIWWLYQNVTFKCEHCIWFPALKLIVALLIFQFRIYMLFELHFVIMELYLI